MTLEEFRSRLDDVYSIQLAFDSRSMASLTAHVDISDECGRQSTFYRLRGLGTNFKTQNLAEITRMYWELVYA